MRLSQTIFILSGKFADHFVRFGGYTPTPLSLKKLIAFGKVGSVQESASFLAYELPVRLANILQEIHLLPEQLVRTPSASLVRRWYEQSFCELMDFEKIKWDEKSLNQFNEILASIRSRHTTVVETMAQVSVYFLFDMLVLMFGSELNKHRRYVGSIDPDCNVREILDDAYEDAKFLCEHYYSAAPEMKVRVHSSDNAKIEFVYVPSHLYHILFELLKNAMRAVVEQHSRADQLPPIKVLIATGQENVAIKISDLGGGIPRSQMDLVFNYTYTTAGQAKRCGETSLLSMEPRPPDQGTSAPMAGYGYGLPLSRLYAKYFNGDLILSSVEGYGTDAIVYLKRNAAEADELLPVFNRTSAKQYGSASIPVADWSNPHITTGWRRN
ncbi:unnamed protein product [Schistosoma mattheei]|uniref:Protein-serine/threonine kinase n=1 Tax=Schistosoma mattheei TaxID=31246 RepID=A0AA85B5Z2_9TREM|nr:unnamed protein product [Schistosoma mattheei]